VLREPGRNMPVRAVNGHRLKCGYRLAWIVIKGNQAARHQLRKSRYARPAKTLDAKQSSNACVNSDAEIAHHERNLRKGEARLPLEEQLRLKLRRLKDAESAELADKVRIEIIQ
jgi:hypothetical protein